MTRVDRSGRQGSVRAILVGGAIALLLAVPAAVAASTGPESPPPPCALGTSTAVAGTPLEVTGARSTDQAVNASAWRTDKTVRDASVATLNGTWRAVFLFGAADGGSWMVDITVDGAWCESPLTVTLPPGVAAPPTEALLPRAPGDTGGSGADGISVQQAVVDAAVLLVLASWVFVLLIGIVHAFGRRTLSRPGVRRVAAGAAFVAILGASLAAWLVVYFGVGMSHFDTGIPTDEQAVLDAGFWVALVAGSVLGTFAALRIGRRPPSGASPS
jgi:hypothetical protein